jgi:hypothetical protein
MKFACNFLSLAILFLIAIGNTNAQFIVNKKELNKVDLINTTLYVLSNELTAKQVEGLQKRDLIDAIRARYISENELLMEVINNYWDLKNIAGELSTKEIARKIESGEEIYYIRLTKPRDRFFNRSVHKLNYYYSYSHYKLGLFRNNKEIISIPLVNEELSELHLHFAIHVLKGIISKSGSFSSLRQYSSEINSNAGKISGRTLLISENLTDYSLEYLQQFYNGQMRIASEDEILSAIHRNREEYVYLMITVNDRSDKPSFNHFILDCIESKPLLVYRNSNACSTSSKHTYVSRHRIDRLDFLFGFHFKKYQRIIDS